MLQPSPAGMLARKTNPSLASCRESRVRAGTLQQPAPKSHPVCQKPEQFCGLGWAALPRPGITSPEALSILEEHSPALNRMKPQENCSTEWLQLTFYLGAFCSLVWRSQGAGTVCFQPPASPKFNSTPMQIQILVISERQLHFRLASAAMNAKIKALSDAREREAAPDPDTNQRSQHPSRGEGARGAPNQPKGASPSNQFPSFTCTQHPTQYLIIYNL